jgi:hypothetical protein
MFGHNDSTNQPFDNIINLRDVGAAVNRHCGLRYGFLLCSGLGHIIIRITCPDENRADADHACIVS